MKGRKNIVIKLKGKIWDKTKGGTKLFQSRPAVQDLPDKGDLPLIYSALVSKAIDSGDRQRRRQFRKTGAIRVTINK